MKIQDLMYYRYLSDCSSFTKTAEAFYVSQPSISIALKRLEDEFDTTLITRDRSNKRFNLTPTGKILYNRADQIISLLEATKIDMSSINSKTSELGIDPLISQHYLQQICPYLTPYMDQLTLIEDHPSAKLINLVYHKALSAAIIVNEEPSLEKDSIDSYLIDTCPMHICVGRQHPLAQYQHISLDQLKNVSFIAYDYYHTQHQIFQDWVASHHLDVSSLSLIKQLQTMRVMLTTHTAVALMPKMLFYNDPKVVSIPIDNAPTLYTRLITYKDATLSQSQQQINTQLISLINSNTLKTPSIID